MMRKDAHCSSKKDENIYENKLLFLSLHFIIKTVKKKGAWKNKMCKALRKVEIAELMGDLL